MSCVFLHVNFATGFHQLFILKFLHQLFTAWKQLLEGAQVLLLVDVSQFVKLLLVLFFQVGWQAQILATQNPVV